MMKRFTQAGQEVKEFNILLHTSQKADNGEMELPKTFSSFKALTTKILDALPISIFLEDREGRTVFCNQTACTLNGMSREELIGKTVYDFFPKHIADKNRKDDLHVWNTKNTLTKVQVVGFQGIESYMLTGKMIIELHDQECNEYLLGFGLDITDRVMAENKLRESEEMFRNDRKKAEEQIEYMAYHDALTGLPNRWYIQAYFNRFFANKKYGNEFLTIFLLDLDHFKIINDSLGHEAGDQLLQKVAVRIKEATKQEDILARLGGDEFLLLAASLHDEEEVNKVCESIIKIMEKPFVIQDKKVNIKTSIGVSIYPKDEKDINTLIKNADLALYQAKSEGRNNYCLFNPTMNEKAIQRMNQEIFLREAIENDELLLHYQPKMNVKTGEIVGVEALVRWQKENQLIYPDAFIQIAEETGLIVPIGEWVLRRACQQCKEWHNAGFVNLTVAVNISPKQFQRNNLELLISKVLEETKLAPHALEVELTESIIMENPEEAALTLKKLKSIGISIAIDDFGTGFSSLSYLKKFPINTLKIDRSFIMSLEKDEANSAIARAIISLAQSLSLSVVAEGVEKKEHLAFLEKEHCEFAQGYFISRPFHPEAFRQFYETRTYS